MLNRREFLTNAAGGFVTLLLTPIVSACGSDTTNGMTTTTNPTVPGCDGAGETSSVALGHTHTLCVPASDLSNPPASGATYSTSVTEGHQHTVTLIQAWLMAIEQGQTVNVTSSSVVTTSAHTHNFAVQKVAAPVAPTPSPPVTGPYY